MSKFLTTLGSGAVLVAAVTLTSGTAQALSCATNVVSAPAAGETDVPTDTLIWGWGYPAAQPTRLLGPAGEVVATDTRIIPVGGGTGYLGVLPVLVPREPLEPNAEYTIVVDHGAAYPAEPNTFTTGAGPASGAPELPVLLSSERSVGGGLWGLTRGLTLTFAFDGILIGDTGQVGEDSNLDALFDAGARLLAKSSYDDDDDAQPFIPWVSRESSVFTGISPCGVWPRGAADTELGRFGVLDFAGHFSGWIEVPLELPSQEEAELAAAAQLEAQSQPSDLNVQQGRPPACSIALLGGTAPSHGEPSPGGLLALGLALAAASGRRAWRPRHKASDAQLDGATRARRT